MPTRSRVVVLPVGPPPTSVCRTATGRVSLHRRFFSITCWCSGSGSCRWFHTWVPTLVGTPRGCCPWGPSAAYLPSVWVAHPCCPQSVPPGRSLGRSAPAARGTPRPLSPMSCPCLLRQPPLFWLSGGASRPGFWPASAPVGAAPCVGALGAARLLAHRRARRWRSSRPGAG